MHSGNLERSAQFEKREFEKREFLLKATAAEALLQSLRDAPSKMG